MVNAFDWTRRGRPRDKTTVFNRARNTQFVQNNREIYLLSSYHSGEKTFLLAHTFTSTSNCDMGNSSSSRRRGPEATHEEQPSEPVRRDLPELDLGSGFRATNASSLPGLILGSTKWVAYLREGREIAAQKRGEEGNGEAEQKKEDGGKDESEGLEEKEKNRDAREAANARLQELRVAFLAKHLRAEERERWTLVFASSMNGASFRRFQHYLVNSGDVIIVIRTEDGALFGGRCANFAHEAHPEFIPDTMGTQFVFSLSEHDDGSGDPQLEDTPFPESWKVWRGTGINEHYQYLNSDTESFFNGIAMGGQQDFFSWCVDRSFENGHCRGSPGTTFGNPQLHLHGTELPPDEDGKFKVAHVEVWSILDPELDEYDLEKERKRRGITHAGSVLRSEDNADKVRVLRFATALSVLTLTSLLLVPRSSRDTYMNLRRLRGQWELPNKIQTQMVKSC
jgi:TLD